MFLAGARLRRVSPDVLFHLFLGGRMTRTSWMWLGMSLAFTRSLGFDPNSPLSPAVRLAVLCLPLTTLLLISVDLWRAWRTLGLFKRGVLAMGRLEQRAKTWTEVHREPILRLRYAFGTAAGDKGLIDAKVGAWTAMPDDAPLLYDPADPRRAVILAALPGSPRVDAEGVLSGEDRLWPLFVLPLVVAAVHLTWTPKFIVWSKAPPAAVVQPRPTTAPLPDPQTDVPAGLMRVRLIYDGQPFVPPPNAFVTFWTLKAKTQQSRTPAHRLTDKGWELDGFETGNHNINVRILARGTPPLRSEPGDWEGSALLAVPTRSGGEGELTLTKVIHLKSPVDNAASLGRFGKACDADEAPMRGPVTFEWEPLDVAVAYRYEVKAVACPYGDSRTVAVGNTTGTRFASTLPPSAAGEFYLFTLNAHRKGRRVGNLTTFGENWNGWDYRFRTAP